MEKRRLKTEMLKLEALWPNLNWFERQYFIHWAVMAQIRVRIFRLIHKTQEKEYHWV